MFRIFQSILIIESDSPLPLTDEQVRAIYRSPDSLPQKSHDPQLAPNCDSTTPSKGMSEEDWKQYDKEFYGHHN